MTAAGPGDRSDEDGLLGAIVRLQQAAGRVVEGISGAAGLSFADYLVLGVVRRSPDGQTSPGAIADVLGRTTGGMSLTLDRLEGAGWLRRSHHASDGRRVVVTLTDAGQQLAHQINEQLHDWESSLELPVSRDEARRVIDHVAAAIGMRTVRPATRVAAL